MYNLCDNRFSSEGVLTFDSWSTPRVMSLLTSKMPVVTQSVNLLFYEFPQIWKDIIIFISGVFDRHLHWIWDFICTE